MFVADFFFLTKLLQILTNETYFLNVLYVSKFIYFVHIFFYYFLFALSLHINILFNNNVPLCNI